MTQQQLIAELPDWLPAEAWAEFVKMRKGIKKPLTEYAAKLVIKKLAEMVRNGQDPQEVLDQSILNCWQGIFEVKPAPRQQLVTQRPPQGTRPQLALVDQNRANTAAARQMLGFDDDGVGYGS